MSRTVIVNLDFANHANPVPAQRAPTTVTHE